MVNMKNIPFEYVEKNIYFGDIEKVVSMSSNSSSYTNKIILSFLFSVFISLPSINYYWGISLLSLIVLSIFLVKYLTLNKFQKIVNYNIYLYIILQTGVIFFLTVFLYMKNDTKHVVPIFYIAISYLLSLFIVYFRVSGSLRTTYNLEQSSLRKLSTLIATKTSKLLKLFVSLIILSAIVYRINKWWLLNADTTFNNVSTLEYIFWGAGLVTILLVLTLLPTLLIKPDKIIKYKLIETYAEDFRKRYDYSKKEWYGDN